MKKRYIFILGGVIGLAAIFRAATPTLTGFCDRDNKYYSSEDLWDSVIAQLIEREFSHTVNDEAKSPDAMKYTSVEQFREINPNCCVPFFGDNLTSRFIQLGDDMPFRSHIIFKNQKQGKHPYRYAAVEMQECSGDRAQISPSPWLSTVEQFNKIYR